MAVIAISRYLYSLPVTGVFILQLSCIWM